MEPTTSGLQVPTKLGLSVSHESLLCTDPIPPPFPSLESSRSHNSLVKDEPSGESSPHPSGSEFASSPIPTQNLLPLDQIDSALLPQSLEQAGPNLSHDAALHKLSIRPRRTRVAKRKVAEKEIREEIEPALPLIVDENGNADPSLAERPKIIRTEGEIESSVACGTGQQGFTEIGLSKGEETKTLLLGDQNFEPSLPPAKKDIRRALSPARNSKALEPNVDTDTSNDPPSLLEERPLALTTKEEINIEHETKKANIPSDKSVPFGHFEQNPSENKAPLSNPNNLLRKNELETIFTAQPCKIEEIGDETVILIPELPEIEEVKQEKITTHTEPPKTEFQVTTISKIADHTAFVVSPTKGVTTSKGKTLVHTSALLLPNEEAKTSFKIEEPVKDDKKETLVIKFEEGESEDSCSDKSSALENVCIERTENLTKARKNQIVSIKEKFPKDILKSPKDAQVKCNIDKQIILDETSVNPSKHATEMISSSPKVPSVNFEYTIDPLLKSSDHSRSTHMPTTSSNATDQVNISKKSLDTRNLSEEKNLEKGYVMKKSLEQEADYEKEDVPQNRDNHGQNSCSPNSSFIIKEASQVLNLIHNTNQVPAKENNLHLTVNENNKTLAEEAAKESSKESALPSIKHNTSKPNDLPINALAKEPSQSTMPPVEKQDKSPPNVIRRTPKPVSVEIIPFSQRIKDPTFIAAPKGWRHSTDLSFTKPSFVEGIVKKMDTKKPLSFKDEPKPERHSFHEKAIPRCKSPEIALTVGNERPQATKSPESGKMHKPLSQWEVKIHHHQAINPERETNEKAVKASPSVQTDSEPELLRVFARRSIKHKGSEKSPEEYESVDLTETLNETPKKMEINNSIIEDSSTHDLSKVKIKETCQNKAAEKVKQSHETVNEHEIQKETDVGKNINVNNLVRDEKTKPNDKTKCMNEPTINHSDDALKKSKDASLNNETGIKFSIISSSPVINSTEKTNEVNKNKFETTKASFLTHTENKKGGLIKKIEPSPKVKENHSITPIAKPVKPKPGLPKTPKPAVLSPKPQIPNKSLNQNEKYKWRSHQNSLNRIDQLTDSTNCKNEASVTFSNNKPASKSNDEKIQRTNSFSPSTNHGHGESGSTDSLQAASERGKESPGAPSWLQLAHQRRELRVQRERLLLGSTSPSFVLEGSSSKPPRSSKVWSMVSNIQKLQMT